MDLRFRSRNSLDTSPLMIANFSIITLVVAACLDVELVQHAVEDRRQHEARGDDDDEAGEDGVAPGEQLARLRLQFGRRPHAGKDHRRVEEAILSLIHI